MAVSADGASLALAHHNHTVTLWNLALGRSAGCIPANKFVSCLSYSPDGKTLAVGYTLGMVEVWDLLRHKKQLVINNGRSWNSSVLFSPDNYTLVVAGSNQPVRVWNLTSGTCFYTIPETTGSLDVKFNHNATLLAVSDGQPTVRIFQTGSWRKVADLSLNRPVYQTAFSPAGGLIATVATDGSIALWETRTWRRVASRDGEADAAIIRIIAFTTGGNGLLVAWSDGLIRMYDTSSFYWTSA